MTLAIQIDRKATRLIRRKLNKVASNLDRAQARAENLTATSAVSFFSKSTRKTVNVKASKLKAWGDRFKGTKIIRAKPGRQGRFGSVSSSGAAILVGGGHIPLYEMGAPAETNRAKKGKGKVGGTKVTVIKGRRILYEDAFIQTMASGHTGVFRRRGKTRLKIDELFGPSVLTLWEKRSSNIDRHILKTLKAKLIQQLQFYKSR